MALQPIYRHKLRWFTAPPNPSGPPPPPPGVQRAWVSTPGGNLELLYSLPQGDRETWKRPLLFVHGGFEQASCYANFLPFFSQYSAEHDDQQQSLQSPSGHPTFAISLRGHGSSYQPGFFRMYFTSKYQLTLDICAAITHIFSSPDLLGPGDPSAAATHDHDSHHRRPEIIIFGHSSGGGLAQYLLQSPLYKTHILDTNTASITGLCLLAAIPCFGSFGVYRNWMVRHDPWAFFRTYFVHFGHPRSPLSSTSLVRGAFFSKELPEEEVIAYEKTMPEWESMVWAFGMMFNGWINVLGVVKGLLVGETESGKQVLERKQRILVVAGSKDKLMTVDLMERMTATYRGLWGKAVGGVWSDGDKHEQEEVKRIQEEEEERVEFQVVEGSGHHLMKDFYWRDCADKVNTWLTKFE